MYIFLCCIFCSILKVCDSIASISTNTFGRRSQRDLIGGCCGDNLCNTHIKPITTPTPEPKTTVSSTTPSTTTENCRFNLFVTVFHIYKYFQLLCHFLTFSTSNAQIGVEGHQMGLYCQWNQQLSKISLFLLIQKIRKCLILSPVK